MIDTLVENGFSYKSEMFYGEMLDKSENLAGLEMDKEKQAKIDSVE